MKPPIVTAGMLFVALTVLGGCRKDETEAITGTPAFTATAQPTGATTTRRSTAAGTIATVARTGKPFPPNGSVIQIDFTGAICHFFPSSGQSRAVWIADADHISKLVVYRPTEITPDDSVSGQKLANAIGGGATASCGPKACVAEGFKGVVIRILDSDNNPVVEPLATNAEFDYLVPHLEKAGPAPAAKLNADLTGPFPKGNFTAFFELDGGDFTARPYCKPVKLDKDHEGRGPRHFAFTTTLRATTKKPARLEFSDDGVNWRKLEFTDGKFILLEFKNDPSVNKPHFHIHKAITDGTVTNFDDISTTVPGCVVSTAVGCGNTQWP